MYKALPKNERTFDFEAEGEITGEQYSGQFTTKCILNMAERHTRELEKTRLTADYANPTGNLAGIAEILSTLRAKLVKWPDWWANLDFGSLILDENVILDIYEKVQALEKDWKAEIRKKVSESKGEDPEQGNE